MNEPVQKFPRDVKILVDRLLQEKELKGVDAKEIIDFWDDSGAYIFGFCCYVELIAMFPQFSLFTSDSEDLLKNIGPEKIYQRLAVAIATSMNDETVFIART